MLLETWGIRNEQVLAYRNGTLRLALQMPM
jgi:hypothetical protein